MKRPKIGGPYVPHTRELIESLAWRALSLSARRLLDRIELEHLRHSGKDNGRLPITFDQFVDYGIHRHAIAPAMRECEALGLLQVTERGCAGNAEFCSPNYFAGGDPLASIGSQGVLRGASGDRKIGVGSPDVWSSRAG
jgi:hypothetical protein